MARKFWVVWADVESGYQRKDLDGWEGFHMKQPEQMALFFREKDAQGYAQTIATKYAGCDIHILKQNEAFTSVPKPAVKKVWDDKGNLVPA